MVDSCREKQLSETEILQMFIDSGALLKGHFLLTSGKHSGEYMQCAQVLQYPDKAALLASELAKKFKGLAVETVVGPAMGGIIVAHEMGKALGVRAIFTERKNGEMTLRRGFKLRKEEKVLVVEDVISTGGSVREVLEIVRALGAEPVGVGVLVDRSGGKVSFGDLPLHSLVKTNIEAYDPESCPLCKEGLKAEKPGSREN
ncbi:MAG: orotate phosphoribosyltransferase [Desulfitobacteriia bacterium]|jgi:orotate phosphoribosyltransferase